VSPAGTFASLGIFAGVLLFLRYAQLMNRANTWRSCAMHNETDNPFKVVDEMFC
jgi:hypothetical protein